MAGLVWKRVMRALNPQSLKIRLRPSLEKGEQLQRLVNQ
jgi:hypothetical protein